VIAKSGHKLWLFSAGKDAVGVETLEPTGKIVGDGRVFYRQGGSE
jgi:hypothetical protein